jgi:hypothetical protein
LQGERRKAYRSFEAWISRQAMEKWAHFLHKTCRNLQCFRKKTIGVSAAMTSFPGSLFLCIYQRGSGTSLLILKSSDSFKTFNMLGLQSRRSSIQDEKSTKSWVG